MTSTLSFRTAVLAFLGTGQLSLLECIDERIWLNNLRWLDRSGLALPLATRLEKLETDSFLPAHVRELLHTRLLDNGKRMTAMLRFFESANRALAASDVRYCCVKGFALVPDCFADIRERHQVDLDFLIAPEDADRARNAIEALGYRMDHADSSGEMRFTKPWKKHLGVNAYLYQMPEAPPVELHTLVWEPEVEAVDIPELSGFLDNTYSHDVAGVVFPRLSGSRQFVYLLLHIFRHLVGSWCRLLSLYEVAMLIREQRGNVALWADASRLIEQNEVVSSACALVIGLVHIAFPTSLPEYIEILVYKHQSSESKLWLDNYAAAWLLTDPPGTKLSLLVQKQFCSNHHTWRHYIRRRMIPVRKSPALHDGNATATTGTVSYRVEQMFYNLGRLWYHVRSDFDYLLAKLEWKQLLRARRT